MGDPSDGGAPAVVDVGHGACDSAGDRDTAEEGDDDVRHALSHQLSVGAMTLTDDPVGYACREEGLYSSEDGDGEGWADEAL